MAKRIDASAVKGAVGSFYPPPFDEPCRAKERRRLGDVAGLTQFGVNLLTIAPGAWSSQRHWHTEGEEFVYVLSGEITLVTGEGEEVLRAGDSAGFKTGEQYSHCLQNRSDAEVRVLEVGSRIAGDMAYYPGLDLVAPPGGKPAMYTHLDGTPYENLRRRGPGD